MEFDCSYDKLVDPKSLVPHPRNNNRHPVEQINKFAEILKAVNVWRYPIVVSKRSGFIISGHGRRDVALKLGLSEVPVNYQEFENEAAEVQQLTFDNAIARWSELDVQAVHLALEEIPELDIDALGIEKFELPSGFDDVEDKNLENDEEKFKLEIQFPNDTEMMNVHDDLISRGYMVKIL